MKSLKNIALSLSFLFIMSCSFGQEQSALDKKFRALKVFSNSEISFKTKKTNGFVSLLRSFSPSIAWGKEYGNFHEIGIQNFNLVVWDRRREFSSLVDYSYNISMLGYNPERKINFYMGAGAQVGGDFQKALPDDYRSYVAKNARMNFDLVVSPRMTVKIGKRALLDVNVPYSIYSKQRVSYFTGNPNVPVLERKRVSTRSSTFPNQFTVKVGVAIKF